jgi:tetratricopeptide (TPR) repeat protein
MPRAYLLLMVGWGISGVLGCATFPGGPSGANNQGSSTTARAETNGPKRQPRASTYVAFGELHERTATEPGRSPAEQEELRNKARLAYQQALQVDPKDLPALKALARLYASEGDYDRALATYNRAIQDHPKDAALRFELGMSQARRKNWDLALQSLQMAIQIDPENRRYRHTYGLCLARGQRYDESLAVLAKLEGAAQAHYDLARMMHHLEQDEAAKEHLRLALNQNPEFFDAQQLLTELDGAPSNATSPITPAAAQSP